MAQPAKAKRGRGRPTLYKRKEHCRVAFAMGLLGATDAQVADAIGISVRMLGYWKRAHPELLQALKEARAEADSKVVHSLYQRATGYEQQAVKVVADVKSGTHLSVPYTERFPPDPTACIFWLKNRRPDLWRDRHTDIRISQSNTNTAAVVPPEVVQRARETFAKKYAPAGK